MSVTFPHNNLLCIRRSIFIYFNLHAVDPLMSCAAQIKQRPSSNQSVMQDCSIHQAPLSKRVQVWDSCKFHTSVQASYRLRHPNHSHPAKIVSKIRMENSAYTNYKALSSLRPRNFKIG